MALRIDKLTPGTKVLGIFKANNNEVIDTDEITFIGIQGEGDDRVANFRAMDGDREYEFGVYRDGNKSKHWTYGTSAEPFAIAPLN